MLDAEDDTGLVMVGMVDECKVGSDVVSIGSSGHSVWTQVVLGSSKGSGRRECLREFSTHDQIRMILDGRHYIQDGKA